MDRKITFLRQIIDINPHFIFVKDRAGRFTLVNEAVASAYGASVDELIGKTDADFNPNADEVEAFRRDDLEVMETQREKLIAEEVVTDATGRTRYLQTIKRPLVDEDGVARHVLGVATDITALKRAEQERRELQVQVLQAQKLESLGVLAGGIAHDFNNLLVGVMANADMVQRKLPPGSPALVNVEHIVLAARRAADLCGQMLAYSGRGHFVIESVDLSALVGELGELLRVSVSKKAALQVDLSPDLPPVSADATQLRQVVMNLITNASDALEGAAGTIVVSTGKCRLDAAELRTRRAEEHVEPGEFVYVEVRDSGVGIHPEQVDRIFDPFYTTKFSGRGLGLAAVLGIARGHRGVVRVTSEPGQGTTVRVLVPVAEASSRSASGPSARVAAGSGRVLVVDDEPLVAGAVRELLEMDGYEVLVAPDGRRALELFRRRAAEIDLVLLDLTMPELGGDEVFRELVVIKPDVVVVLMSGYNEGDASRRFEGHAPAGFLQKPFQAAELDRIVRVHLHR